MGEYWKEQEIRDWIDQHTKEMTEDIRSLVKIPSIAEEGSLAEPYGKACRQVLEEMQKIGRRMGFETENHENRCLSISYGAGEKELGIWGHLDVVPEGEGWQYPPFACIEKEGFLIGRGVQDNKGPAVACLYAMRYLKEKGFCPAIRFRQILGCKEEKGMEDAEYYLAHYRAPDFSIVADCSFPVCCGEKGILNVKIRSPKLCTEIEEIQGGTASNAVPDQARAKVKGEVIEAKGIAGHAAFPEGSKNAVGVLCRRIAEKVGFGEAAISVLALLSGDGYGKGAGIACEDEPSGLLTCNLGVVKTVGDRVEAELDIRYPVTKKAEEILSGLEKFLKRYGYEILEKKDSPSNYIDPGHPFVCLLMDIWKTVMETPEGEPYVMGGGTYARKIPNAVGFGPGMEADRTALQLPKGHGDCHSADEAQSLAALKKAVEIYINALERISGYFENMKSQK